MHVLRLTLKRILFIKVFRDVAKAKEFRNDFLLYISLLLFLVLFWGGRVDSCFKLFKYVLGNHFADPAT